MAFSEPVRPHVTPCRIPLLHNRHCPGHKKMFEKKNGWQFKTHRLDLVMKCVTHTFCMACQDHVFRPKYTVIFIKSRFFEPLTSLVGSRTPPPVPGSRQGHSWPLGTAWRSILAATPSTAAISTPFLNGSSANPLLYSSDEEGSANTAQSRKTRKKHPQHPPDQKFRFFHFCKNIRVVYDFPGFVSGFCISGWFSARAPL